MRPEVGQILPPWWRKPLCQYPERLACPWMIRAWCCKQVGEMVSPTPMCLVNFTFCKSKSIISVKEVMTAVFHGGRNQGIWLWSRQWATDCLLLTFVPWIFIFLSNGFKQGGLRCYSKATVFLVNYAVNHKDLEFSFNPLLTNEIITIYGVPPHPSMFTMCTESSMWCPSTGAYDCNYRKDRYCRVTCEETEVLRVCSLF